MINKILKQTINTKRTYTLCRTIEDVYFVYIDEEMLLNSLDREEAEEFYDICIRGYKFFSCFKKK